ncbi:MAG: flagellar hook-length control protein FliK, partial [Luminiphilus sp.]|nr:flagellar hook-length control protein FliK [Luminiphilus sp.]
ATSHRAAAEMPGLPGQSADTAVRAGLTSNILPAASTSITALDADSTLATGPNTSANTLLQTEASKVAPRLSGQGFVDPSKGAVASSGFIEGPESHEGEVANAAGTLKNQNSLTTPRSAPLATSTVAAAGLSATPMSPSDMAGNQKSAVTSPAMGVAQSMTPSASAVTGLSATPPPTNDMAGTQKSAVTSTAMGAAQDTNANQPTARATNTKVVNGLSNRPVGGAVSMAQGTNLATELGTTEVSGKGGSEITRALQGESFGAALNSSLVRAKGFREGSPVDNQPRTRAADAPSVAGLNPTPRLAEASTMSAATQVPAMKATPDSAEFPQEVVARVRMIQGQGQTEARLNLHPAELGRLQIAITSEGDATRVAFVVDNAQAKEALEQAMPRLREFLQQAGLQLTEGSVSQQGQQDSAGFAQTETRSGDGLSANAQDAEENGVINGKPDRGSDPNRMLDAYA